MRLSSSIVGEGENGWMKVVIVAELLLVSKSVSVAADRGCIDDRSGRPTE